MGNHWGLRGCHVGLGIHNRGIDGLGLVAHGIVTNTELEITDMGRKREPKHPQRLAKLKAARARYATKRLELEAKAALIVEEGMAAEDALINQLVRELYDGGESIAEIQRAYGTRDYRTIKGIIESTVSELGIDVSSDIYSYDDRTKVLSVNYTSHGSRELTGAVTIGVWSNRDGGLMLMPIDGVTTPLNEDQSGILMPLTPLAPSNEYQTEALEFLATQRVTLKGEEVLDNDPQWEDDGEEDLRTFLRPDSEEEEE